MPTADSLALITAKKLLGYIDFDVYLKQYLVKAIREATKRLFIQGSFDERMPLSSPGADQVQVDLKPTYGDGFAHDGSGRLLDLEQIDRTAYFENVGGQTYEVGAEYIEVPVGIRVNPRTGKYEYDHLVEGIGRQAAPDSTTVNASTLTFVVDSLFEQGVSPGNHTGRQVRAFSIVPGDVATSEAVAIETCTVFYDGQNKITTTGFLGESVPGAAGGHYVQLIGLTVFRDTATNRPSLSPKVAFFIGTVDGNGGTPTGFDVSAQNVISNQSADLVSVDPLSNWFDGSPNAATTVQAALEKIVSDLAATTGSEKLGSGVLPDWFDANANPSDSIQNQLYKIVDDLAKATGGGASKISAQALADWADGTTNPLGSVQALFANIVGALTSTTGLRGAGKLTVPARSDWADGTTNPAARLDEALEKIVSDLTSTVGFGGTGKIQGVELGSDPYAIGSGQLVLQLAGLQVAVSETAVFNERRTEFAALRNVDVVYADVGGGSMRDVAARHFGDDPNEYIMQMIAVGDGNTIARFLPGQNWVSVTPDAGFAGGFGGVAYGGGAFVIVGATGEIQSGLTSFTRRKTGGSDLHAVAYMGGLFCAVGDSGNIWTSSDGTTWTQRTGAAGTTTQNYVGIATDGAQFVVLVGNSTAESSKIMTSADGITWTEQVSAAAPSTAWLRRQIQYTPRHGFVALRITNSDVALARSDDGVNWIVYGAASNDVVILEASFRLCLLDRQVAFLHSNGTLYNAIVTEQIHQSPDVDHAGDQNVFHVADCVPAGVKNIKGTLHVFGQNAAGDAVILTSAPIRPNTIYGV